MQISSAFVLIWHYWCHVNTPLTGLISATDCQGWSQKMSVLETGDHLVKTNCTGAFMMPQTFGTNFLLNSDVPIPLRCLGQNWRSLSFIHLLLWIWKLTKYMDVSWFSRNYCWLAIVSLFGYCSRSFSSFVFHHFVIALICNTNQQTAKVLNYLKLTKSSESSFCADIVCQPAHRKNWSSVTT